MIKCYAIGKEGGITRLKIEGLEGSLENLDEELEGYEAGDVGVGTMEEGGFGLSLSNILGESRTN